MRQLLRLSRIGLLFRRYSSTNSKSIEELEREYTSLRIQSGLSELSKQPENVLVVHPKIRWGKNAAPFEDVTLKIEEACALVKTLPGFSICGTMVIGTDYTVRKKFIWGSGRLDALKEQQMKSNATAVMINVDILSPVQQSSLNDVLNVPVFDRYNLVLWIFKFYARTPEAHLQISLAEIPYIRERLKHSEIHGIPADIMHIAEPSIGINSAKLDRFEVLRLREHSIKKKIKAAVESKTHELEQRRSNFDKRAKRSILIAIIGYTNAGKTSLIKSLTGSTSIFGEDRLFATLDTTLHHAILPSSNSSIFLADTIGFISDLPVSLIASFEATLRHVINADLLIHIEDLSHPNVEVQRANVIQTLRDLNIRDELINNMIHISNKVDKLTPEKLEICQIYLPPSNLLISCRSGLGLPKLVELMDQKVQALLGVKTRIFRLKHGSEVVNYLYSEGLVSEEPEYTDEYLEFKIKMTDEQFQRLKAHTKVTGTIISKQ